MQGQCFGETAAFVYSVEFQKRGLPHAHIIVWLKRKPALDSIDRYVSAELPNPGTQPRLFKVITSNNIHTCNSDTCRKGLSDQNRECRKRFPNTSYLPDLLPKGASGALQDRYLNERAARVPTAGVLLKRARSASSHGRSATLTP